MSKYKLTDAQKDEVRRLTQLANRRIKTAEKQYREQGKIVAPHAVVGDIQEKSDWHTPNTPLSRSVVFGSKKEYMTQLRFLRSFDPKAPGQTKPNMKEYTVIQRSKTAISMKSALGMDVPTAILEQINQMSAPQLSEFWKVFSDKASKMLLKYSSVAAMQETLNEIMSDDYKSFINDLTGTASRIENRQKAG